ncbi:hypothetical protein KF728_12800 [Candidatus Obscuribacterales bacterium]|nr:hypothetical protein [Candidatus Obscuribacterales bacterium]MBX3151022.1 hypothetical protein [Candidatus Obscuribacterales bacterium]
MSTEPENSLVSKDKRFATYTISEYVEYCDLVRESLGATAKNCRADNDFFRRKFVDEMEILAKVCVHSFGRDRMDVWVRYLDAPLADGEIVFPDESRNFFVEITSTKDHRLIDYAVEQMKQGRLISISGHTGDDVPRLRNGVCDDDVEAEEDTVSYSKQRSVIERRIGKKLNKTWQDRDNWLCIVIDDLTHWDELSLQSLSQISEEFRERLRTQYISKLWFVGYDPKNLELPFEFCVN